MSDRYDPLAVEDSPAKSEYLTRKDAKWLVILLLIGAVAAVPVYRWGNEKKNKTLCSRNIKAIGDALNLYAENNDDRFPPLFESDANGSPAVETNRAPVTWASVIGQYHNGRADLRCPAAESDEAAMTRWRDGNAPITYGFYAAHATVIRSNIDSPDETLLVAETSNLGSQGSFDPIPYKDPGGRPISDAFVIGWDNSNTEPNPATKAVTRLAFRKTGGQPSGPESEPRHSEGIHAVTVSGRQVLLKPERSQTSWGVNTLRGEWRSQP